MRMRARLDGVAPLVGDDEVRPRFRDLVPEVTTPMSQAR